MAQLLFSGGDVESRLDPLLRALRTLRFEKSFSLEEDPSSYPQHADALALNGFRNVLFGHTHLAKSIPLPSGARYMNTGTWCDLIQLPARLFAPSVEDARPVLREFVNQLLGGERSLWARSRPHYAKIVADGSTTSASLHEYTGELA